MKKAVKLPEEPVVNGISLGNSELVKLFNWYNENKTEEEIRGYLLDHLKLTPAQKKASDYVDVYITTGIMCRILKNGAKIKNSDKRVFDQSISYFIEDLDRVVTSKGLEAKKGQEKVINLQERVQNKSDELIGMLEVVLDQFYVRTIKSFDAYKWMQEQGVKAIHAENISNFFTKQANEFSKIIKDRKKDDYLAESYPRSDKEMKAVVEFCTNIAQTASQFASNKKATRKPRKRKVISASKRVEKLNYKKEDSNFKLVSVNPEKVVGAEKIWVFNTKTRQLGVYVATDASGLNIKGSTVIGFLEEKSLSKRLRKPEEVLKTVLTTGKVGLRKVLENIKAKPQKLTGRINRDTILLRIE